MVFGGYGLLALTYFLGTYTQARKALLALVSFFVLVLCLSARAAKKRLLKRRQLSQAGPCRHVPASRLNFRILSASFVSATFICIDKSQRRCGGRGSLLRCQGRGSRGGGRGARRWRQRRWCRPGASAGSLSPARARLPPPGRSGAMCFRAR